jgi:hypothetical protein
MASKPSGERVVLLAKPEYGGFYIERHMPLQGVFQKYPHIGQLLSLWHP